MTPEPPRPAGRADVLAAAAGLALLAYVVLRAALVPITHDEAFTFLHWSSAPWRTILLFDAPERANNHLLNTLLMKLSAAAFGPGEAALRLPNLLAFVSFLAALWLLLRRHAPPVLALSGFALAAANRHVLEMFSLARGYGLCLGLLLPGLWLASRAVETPEGDARHEARALVLVALAVLAQFVALDVFCALAGVLLAAHLLDSRGEGRGRSLPRRIVPLAAASLALAAGVGGILVRISGSGGFYAGGTTGLWHDVVGNLVWLTLLPAPWLGTATRPVLLIVAVLLALVGASVVRLLARRPRDASERVALAFGALLALTALAVEVQHALLGLRYPTDRIATPFVPLFAIAVTLAAATAPPAIRRWTTAVLAAVAVLAVVHLARVADVGRSALWWFDADTRRAVADVADFTRKAGRPGPTRLGAVSHCEPALNYSRVAGALYWLAPVERLGAGPWGYDLVYVTGAEAAEAQGRGFTVHRRYAGTGNLLLLPPRGAAKRQEGRSGGGPGTNETPDRLP